MKVIDAIQLPEVLNGSKWVAFVMQGTTLPCQTFRVNSIGQMVWCDNDSSAEFSLSPAGLAPLRNRRDRALTSGGAA